MSIFSRVAALVPGGQVAAASAFLVENWKLAVAVGLTVVSLGATYWAGGRAPRAELEAERAKVAQERAEQEAEDNADVAASSIYVTTLEEEHAEKLKAVDAGWAAYFASLPKQPSSKPASKPVQPSPQVCADQAGNNRLSDALALFREEVRAVIADERSAARASREDAARLLVVCDKQASALETVVHWVLHEQVLWDEDNKPLTLQ